jgi:nicotinate-nucleotide adenylyltransferase
MRPVGIFGGTFDPIHTGHLLTASVVKEIRNLGKIIFIPAFVSPHKTDQNHSESKDRLEMVRLAIKDIPGFEVSDIEIVKQKVSYTIDTLRELKMIYPDIELIIGYDNLRVFDKWKDPDEIFKLVKVVVLNRQSANNNTEKNVFLKKAVFVNTPVIEISSTEIRRRVRNNSPVDFFVPQPVKEYIIKHKLYKD